MSNVTSASQLLWQVQHGFRETAATGIADLVAANADIGDVWIQAARAALTIGELSLAETCARKFLQKNPAQLERVLHSAGVFAEAGRFEKALKLIRPQLKKNPEHPSLNHFLGTVYQQLGDRPRAARHLRQALKSAAFSGVTWLTLAAQHRFKADDPLLERMRSVTDKFQATDAGNRMQYQYALGKALLDIGEYDAAFDAFEVGARSAPQAGLYDAHVESKRVDSVIANSGAASLQTVASSTESAGRAWFVVGLPRTGTTLLQRILGAHSKIGEGGEFAGMGVATMDVLRENPAGLAALSQLPDAGRAAIDEVASLYQHLARERFGGAGTIIDKSINNTYYAGTIALAFPAAPIIIVERDILDVAWSCFRTCFNQGQHWSWSQSTIASHLQAETRLIEHWKQVLADRVAVIKYEDLVREPEAQLRGPLERSGLKFEANMLGFHKRKSPVTTASVAQVDQPLSDSAIGSARHVAHRLQPFIDAYGLTPVS